LVAPLGVAEERVFKLEPGQILKLTGTRRAFLGEKVSLTGVYVDSYGTEDLGGKILRDRQILSSDGVLVVTVALKEKTTPVSIEFSSRGFAAEKDLTPLFSLLEMTVKSFFAEAGAGGSVEREEISKRLRKELSKIVQQKTFRRPLILPILLDV
jgi:ribonuclease J